MFAFLLLIFFGPINRVFCWPGPCPACCSMVRAFSWKVGGSKLQLRWQLSQHRSSWWWRKLRATIIAPLLVVGEEERNGPAFPSCRPRGPACPWDPSGSMPAGSALWRGPALCWQGVNVPARRKEEKKTSPGKGGAALSTELELEP